MKERLVGAAVLMAAAIILVPEMLSGPKRSNETVATRGGEAPIKTYTIDLNRSPGAPVATPIEEAAPPPESEPAAPANAAPASDAPAENTSESTQTSPESTSADPVPIQQPEVAAQSQPKPVAPEVQSAPSQEPVATRQPEPARPASSVPTSRGWAVQLGSFASRATADRLVKDFSGSGYSAFVMPVKAGASTLYRVRVGPFTDRAAADEALGTIKKRVGNAAVVAHP